MKISIIIPSYNQATFLKNALVSILTQEHDSLEVIVVDGGSNDNSVDVIKEFESQIAWWVSEKDSGQTDAINKGLRQSEGDVWAFLNSDDLLEHAAVKKVVRFFQDNPDAEWLSGSCRVFGEGNKEWFVKPIAASSQRDILTPWGRPHPHVFPQSGACFMRRSVIEKIGYFDATYHYSMDVEYYTRAVFQGIQQYIIPDCLAAWRMHADAKTSQKGMAYAFREDEIRIAETYAGLLNSSDQIILRQEIRQQHRDLMICKANWNCSQGNTLLARTLLWNGVRKNPSFVMYRPWLRTLKRTMFENPKR